MSNDGRMYYSTTKILQGAVEIGNEVVVRGWVRTRRDSKAGMSFVALYDGSGFQTLQVIAPQTLPNYQSEVLNLGPGCSVEVSGVVVESPAKGQTVELQAHQVDVLGWVEDPMTYPMSAKHHTMEHLREHAHLRPRTNIIGAVTRVRHCLAKSIHRFLDDDGFYWINTPIITASDCEGAGELFRVSALDMANLPRDADGKVDFSQDFFGRESFLTVSGQLNVEAYCLALSKVYTFGPTFRAENSNTTRHLAEFWMVEPEIAYADLNDCEALAERMLRTSIETVLSERADDMAFFNKWVDKTAVNRLEHVLASRFECMDYSDAIKHLKSAKKKFEFPVEWGIDLQTEHERYLTDELIKGPVFVRNYPKDIKAFYMRLNDRRIKHGSVKAGNIRCPTSVAVIAHLWIGSEAGCARAISFPRHCPARPGNLKYYYRIPIIASL